MLVPTTRLFQAGEQLTGSMLNQTVTSLGNFMLGKPVAFLYQTTAMTSPNGIKTTNTAVLFDSETVDRDGAHSTSSQTSRYTAKTPGYYRVSGVIVYDNPGAQMVSALVGKNGSIVVGGETRVLGQSNYQSVQTPMTLVYMNGTTDYVEIYGRVATTATNTVCSSPLFSSMTVEWVSL